MSASTRLCEAMDQLRFSTKYSDLVITCQGQDFHVHRAIICPHSTFFDSVCSGDFKEAHSNRIDLPEDDPDTVERMIAYMYTFDYNNENHQNPESDNGSASSKEPAETSVRETESILDQESPVLDSNVQVYAIAEKYGIQPLKELAKGRFCTWAESNWNHKDFPGIVRDVFQSTRESDRGMRDVVVRIVAKHAKKLTEKTEVQYVIQENGDLGLGTLRQVVATHSEDMSNLGARLRELEAETEVLKEEITRHKQRLTRQADEIQSTIDKINSLAECRHCQNMFNVAVEGYRRGIAMVRCKNCQTAHFQN